MNKSIYDFSAILINGKEIQFSEFKGKVLLIVNTASKCGFTPQFEGLEKLYSKYLDKGFSVLGFPCNQFNSQDPDTDENIMSFCSLNYGVTFPMYSKIDVNGKKQHPLFKFLKEKRSGFLSGTIKWNFTKFLVDREGNVVNRFGPSTEPAEIDKYVENIL
jgi:glutathione peroxidase